jgi:hypothetical protein
MKHTPIVRPLMVAATANEETAAVMLIDFAIPSAKAKSLS